MSKFSKFVQEAAQKGLLTLTRLENGQFEIAPPGGKTGVTPMVASGDVAGALDEAAEKEEGEERGSRRRRGRGRGRGGRDREPREPRVLSDVVATAVAATEPAIEAIAEPVEVEATVAAAPTASAHRAHAPRAHAARNETPRAAQGRDSIGLGGERLTRNEAFDLVRKAVAATVKNDTPASMLAVRESAAALLGRDSESLSERNFTRILQDAHDADVVDLRKRGDSWEVAPVQEVAGLSEQLAKHEAAHAPKPAAGPPAPRGMGSRGSSRGGRLSAPPPELLMVGVVDESPLVSPVVKPVTAPALAVAPSVPSAPSKSAAKPAAKPVGRKPAAKKSAGLKATAAAKPAGPVKAAKSPVVAQPPAARKSAPAAKKAAAKSPAKKLARR